MYIGASVVFVHGRSLQHCAPATSPLRGFAVVLAA